MKELKPITSQLITVCSAVIIISFFLPWGQFLGQGVSGYTLGTMGSYANFVWLMPVSAGILIWLNFQKNMLFVPLCSFIAGTLPFGLLLYGLSHTGLELFHVLGIGAYLTLFAAVGLFGRFIMFVGEDMDRYYDKA